MTNGKESRRSFRIFESVHLSYEIISDREFHEGLERRKIRLGVNDGVSSRILDLDARLSERLYILRSESAVMADCISLLNEKFSVVIDQLPEMRKAKSSLTRTEPQTCELGADGMLFGTDRELPPGTRLALRFLLRSNNRYVESFAQVQREAAPPAEEEEDAGRFAFGVAVEFLGMQQSQKEIIIQHLFSRECETLRMRKRQNDSATDNATAATAD